MYMLLKIDDNTIIDVDLTQMLNIHVKVDDIPFPKNSNSVKNCHVVRRHSLIIENGTEDYVAMALSIPNVCEDCLKDSVMVTDILTRLSVKVMEGIWSTLDKFNTVGASQGQARPLFNVSNYIHSELTALGPLEAPIYNKYFSFDCILLQRLTEQCLAKQGNYGFFSNCDNPPMKIAYEVCNNAIKEMGKEFIMSSANIQNQEKQETEKE